jgi:pimeloyl-ACP methyl ester carboxylesterase
MQLPTLFLCEVRDHEERVEIAFIPDGKHDDRSVFQSVHFNRDVEVWIDLRGYYGSESFIVDTFVRPVELSVQLFRGSWNVTLRFAYKTRKVAGTLVGRVLVKLGRTPSNVLADDFTMASRLARSESAYASRAREVPRLDRTPLQSTLHDACAIWVHGTLSCGLEGLKDLQQVPKIPMYRFEHDTFHEIADNASELADLVRGLGYKRIYLLAHSRGGLVARFAQQILVNRHSISATVMTFGTPHYGTDIADMAAGGLALFMRAGDFLVSGIPHASMVRRIAGMYVGLQLPPGIAVMQPSSEVLKASRYLLTHPFTAWGGVYREGGGSVGYGQDYTNVANGAFGPNVDHDLVVPTSSSLGGCAVTQIECGHSDYLKNKDVQDVIASLT